MIRNKIIESTIIEAKTKFQKSIEEFWPAYSKNGFNERNITFHFAHAFANRPCSCAFMEVPFLNKKSKRHDLHIDCYVFDNEIGIFVESKRLYSIEKANSISSDIKKMNHKNISYILKNRHEENPPNSIYTLVLAESWSPEINNWWKDGESDIVHWDDRDFPDEMIYDVCEIEKWGDLTLSWLYAYRRMKI